VDVVLYNATVGALTPSCSVNYVSPTATLRIVKTVINTFAGTFNPLSFIIHVTQNGSEVFASPATTLGSTGREYTLAPGNYILWEERVEGYRGIWSGPISSGGTVTLMSGQDVTVTRTNFDLNPTPGAFIYVDTSTAINPVTPTETGGVLPITSAPWGNELLFGGGLILLGTIGFSSRKFFVK
jgi:Prealbumin-like fold domain